MKSIILAALFFALTGCLTTKKATEFLKENGQLANACAENFPPIIKRDSFYTPAPADSSLSDAVARYKDSVAKRLAELAAQKPDSANCERLRAEYAGFLTKSLQKADSLEKRLKTACKEKTLLIKEIDTIRTNQQRNRADSLFYLLQKERSEKAKVEAEKATLKDRVRAQRRTIWTVAGTLGGLLLLLAFGIGYSIRKKARKGILSS